MQQSLPDFIDQAASALEFLSALSSDLLLIDPIPVAIIFAVLVSGVFVLYFGFATGRHRTAAAHSGRLAFYSENSLKAPAHSITPRLAVTSRATSPKPHNTPVQHSAPTSPQLDRLNSILLKLAATLSNSQYADLALLRQVSLACDEIGEAFLSLGRHAEAMEAFQISLTIAQRLADPAIGDAESQRDLSLSLDHVGDVLMGMKQWKSALEHYRSSLVIASRLAAINSDNREVLRDLSIGQENYGDVLMALGQRRDAIDIYSQALAVREQLASAEPTDCERQLDLAVSLYKLARTGHESQTHLERAFGILLTLDDAGQLDEARKGWIRLVMDARANVASAQPALPPAPSFPSQLAQQLIGATTDPATLTEATTPSAASRPAIA